MKVTVFNAFINQCMNKSIMKKFGVSNDNGDVIDIGESLQQFGGSNSWIQVQII